MSSGWETSSIWEIVLRSGNISFISYIFFLFWLEHLAKTSRRNLGLDKKKFPYVGFPFFPSSRVHSVGLAPRLPSPPAIAGRLQVFPCSSPLLIRCNHFSGHFYCPIALTRNSFRPISQCSNGIRFSDPSIDLPFRSHIPNHSLDLSPDLPARCRSLDIMSHFQLLSTSSFFPSPISTSSVI